MINNAFINHVENIYTDGGQTTINIKEAPIYDGDQYDLDDDKDFRHFLDDLKRTVRNSFEYRNMINYLKETDGMDECSVLENATSRDNSGVRIELHHSPLTLEDICLAVVKRRIANRENLDLNACAYEVMYNHYAKWVGLIPLSATVHELVHNAYFFIPPDKVFGDYRPFKETYYNYIDPAVLDSIDNAEQAAKDYDPGQMGIFNNHKIYVNPVNYDFNRFMDLKPVISSRIDEIKSGQVPIMPQETKKVMCRIVDNSKPRTF